MSGRRKVPWRSRALQNATLGENYIGAVTRRIVSAAREFGQTGAIDELADVRAELIFLQTFS